MKRRSSSPFLTFCILSVCAILVPRSLRAQAPAGPLPAAQPQTPPASTAKPEDQQPAVEKRTSIIGLWRVNRYDSDDPRKKMEQASNDAGRRGGGSGVPMGLGIPGVGLGGPGGYGGGRGGASEQEQQRLQAAITPANSLTLAQKDPKDPQVDLTDDQNRKYALFTDGRKIEKPSSKDDSYQEISAHWEGTRLVTDEKSPHGGKMSRTFELSYDGTQLYETIHLTTGRSNTPLDVRYVYDAAPSTPAQPNQ